MYAWVQIRGTTSWHDAVADLTAHCDDLFNGKAHAGMLFCARGILQRDMETIKSLVTEHPG